MPLNVRFRPKADIQPVLKADQILISASYSHDAKRQRSVASKTMIFGSDYMKNDRPPHICEPCYREQKPAQEYVCAARSTMLPGLDMDGSGKITRSGVQHDARI